MEENKVYNVIGLMSGTSTDGIDAAFLRTDGDAYIEVIDSLSMSYDDELRSKIKSQFGKNRKDADVIDVEREITLKHSEIVNALVEKVAPLKIDLVGFHGQTIYHAPDIGETLQIGDADLLSKETGIDVVYDFRSADVKAGGEGAPLLPIYHKAIALRLGLETPCAFLNIGGVSNVTYIGNGDDIVAFDCGAGNALMDDVMLEEYSKSCDKDGLVASKGNVNDAVLKELMSNSYFDKLPPKSLDRDAWDLSSLQGLSIEDKVSTLTEFTVQGIVNSQDYMNIVPKKWYVCGGGRHNSEMIARLSFQLQGDVCSIDDLGLNGDMLEAEGFAYLAVRSLKNLPLSLPSTRGVKSPQSGGQYRKAA